MGVHGAATAASILLPVANQYPPRRKRCPNRALLGMTGELYAQRRGDSAYRCMRDRIGGSNFFGGYMTTFRGSTGVIAAAALCLFSHATYADMGKSPAGPNGIVLSFEGGYLYQDGPDVTGHGISDVVVASPSDPVTDILVSPDSGYFVGGLIGFDTGKPFLFGFHRVELGLLYGRTDDSAHNVVSSGGDIVLSTVDGAVLGTGGATASTSIERKTWEGALRFEDDDVVNETTTVTWVLAPFIRGFDEDTRTAITTSVPCCEFGRTASVDATLYGIFVAAEPEKWLSPNLALVGRIGAGVYGYDADGKFRSAGTAATTGDFDATVTDGDSGAGFRGLLGIGLKLKIAPSTLLEGFAEADYFSNVPTAHLTSNSPAGGYVSHVQDDDLWELRTGVRLTLGFGPGSN